ncbi:MAG: Gfo/Idh/MocA family oxidoreductase [Bacteroidaceae bacterium]|nr:Gfo/Idh/MocA family oxidoreductase [Bacteroidaceae bacterium]
MENMSRRNFLKAMGATTAGVVLSSSPVSAAERIADKKTKKKKTVSEEPAKVKLACVGIANRGRQIIGDLEKTGLCEIVALCDVDPNSKESKQTIAEHPNAKVFTDFREMFDKCANEFEAVSVAIPDFSHFPVCMLAISMGKHVYVEKPLARTFQEIELLMDIARRHPEVVTQVGNQGHSEANYFQFKAWKEAGIIKDVYRIDAHFNDWRRWYPYDPNTDHYPEAQPVPDGMNWNVWNGTSHFHDYNDKYHPGNWRGWFDFGLGALGDWGAHLIDTCHEFLELGLPYEVEPLKITDYNDYFFPKETTLRFRFPSRGDMPPVDLTWYDGEKNLPPLPEGYGSMTNNQSDVPASGQNVPGKDAKLSPGKIIYSKTLTFRGGSHGSTLRIIPEAVAREMKDKLPEVPQSPSNHFANFLLACQGKEQTRSPFAVFGPMAQCFSLGIIAIRTQSKIQFDARTKTITNNAFANALLTGMPPRKGWEEYYKL